MKPFNVVNVSLVVVGAILIYCGVKNITPYEALQMILTGSKANNPVFAGTGQGSKGSAFGPKGGSAGGGGGGGGTSGF